MKNDNIDIFDLLGFAAADGFVIVTSMPEADLGRARRKRTFNPNV